MRFFPRVIHPFLIAPFPILLLYSRNLRAVEATEALLPAAITLAATLVAWGILQACRLDGPRAALIVSAALVLFFSFGPGVRLWVRLGIEGDREVREWMTLGIEAVAMASVIGFVLLKPDLSRSLTGACNVSASVLACLTVAGIVSQTWSDPRAQPLSFPTPVIPKSPMNSGRLPDVYFLVLDAYGRSDVLKEVYGFDNSDFLDRLEQKGFVVAKRSRSNYCQTALSLSATLNLRYLDDLAGNLSQNRLSLKQVIADNVVFRAFREQGYRIVSFASGFDATEAVDSDLMLGPSSSLSTFQALVANQTPLWILLGRRAEYEPHRRHRARILKVFDDLPVASHPSDSPTFTFAHIVSPHPPFVFGADGSDVSARERIYALNDCEGWREMEGHGGSDDYASRYREQVTYITARVEEAVDRILASSPSPPIIIIQGDHGPGSRYNSCDDQPNDLRERMSNLSACYLPPDARGLIHDEMTPINTMRIVVDQCLGSKLGVLEDRNYYSSYSSPFVFTDVTNAIEAPAKESPETR